MTEALIPTEVVLPSKIERDPEEVIQEATHAANAVRKIIVEKGLARRIGSGEHVEYEGWLTVGRFYGCIPDIEWSRPVKDSDGKITGYEARACLIHLATGRVISHAESMCSWTEDNWKNRDEFAVRSMSETRAASKALRMVFGWVMVLAGYKPTPAEEMPSNPQSSSQSSSRRGRPAKAAEGDSWRDLFRDSIKDIPTEKLARVLGEHGYESVDQIPSRDVALTIYNALKEK